MLVRRIGITFVGAGLVASSLFAGSASSQETTTTTTTTTAVPATTTTAVPATTTTAPATTTTTVALPPVVETPELFGDTIASGQLDVAIGWFESTPNNCVETIDLATSGQVNAVTDEDGNLGAVYGMADSAGGSAAVLMIGFGAVPVGVGVVSIDDAACSIDALGIGGVVHDAQRLRIDGVGAGMHSGDYSQGEFATSFVLDAQVSAVTPGANLDLTTAQAFLERPRG